MLFCLLKTSGSEVDRSVWFDQARQAFRALRSLVKLQAFARGAYVRKQANIAIRCMKALVRLQVRVRSRQLLLRTGPRERNNT